MSFWHTVLAIMVGNAIYDLIWTMIKPDEDPDDDDYAI